MSAKVASSRLLMEQVSWRRMLEAIPRQNATADVKEREDGSLQVMVGLRPPRWLIPPLKWFIKLSTRKYVEIDPIGGDVWRWCDGAQTVEDVVDAFAVKYRFSFHEARIAVTGYLRSLIQRGIVAIETTGG